MLIVFSSAWKKEKSKYTIKNQMWDLCICFNLSLALSYRGLVWQKSPLSLYQSSCSFNKSISYMCIFFLGLGRLSQAEEYLAQAQWTVLKTPECPDSIKSKLFRNLGLLYAAQGNYPDALSQLADDVSLTDCLTSHQISIRMD